MTGLVAGISLQKAGHDAVIVSTGQSALHFNSGSLSLIDSADIASGISALPASHPYAKIGTDSILSAIRMVAGFFHEAGIELEGDPERPHYRLSPTGEWRRAWLTLKGFATAEDPSHLDWGKTTVVNIYGFLDFYPAFICRSLTMGGIHAQERVIKLPAFEQMRKSHTEMRATNIARMAHGETINQLADELNRIAEETDAQTLVMPAVIGLKDAGDAPRLRSLVKAQLKFINTIPISVGGLYMQMRLASYFRKLGGTLLPGDMVTEGHLQGNKITDIVTQNLGDDHISADNYILASGSFISHGLKASPTAITEPIFGFDVDALDDREQWTSASIYDDQPYMSFGVATDSQFHTLKDGMAVENCYAAGSILSGANPLREGSGAGIAILTALHVAELLTKKSQQPNVMQP